MKRILITRLCILIACVFLFPLSTPVVAQAKYKYSYIFRADDLKIGLVDPVNLNAPIEVHTLNVPSDSALIDVIVSPNGQLLALHSITESSTPPRKSRIRLLNVISGEMREVAQGYFLSSWSGIGILEPESDIKWSPDSHYVALAMSQPGPVNLYVYSLADGSLVNLTNDQANHYRFTWSKDSTRIVAGSELCPEAQPCTRKIEVFDAAQKTRETTLDVSYFQDTPGFALCAFRWSPDRHYISFVTGCSSLFSLTKEVYVWDVVQGSVTQVTNFTVEASKRKIDVNYTLGKYDTIWADPQTLVIGAIFSDNPDTASTQTLMFHLPSKTITVLSMAAVEGWTANPVSGELAFRTIPAISSLGGFRSQTSSVQIGAVSGKTLKIAINAASISGVEGCDLAWSPDGAILSYTIRGASCTEDKVQGFGFIDKATGNVRRRMFSAAEQTDIDFFYPRGWVVAK
jgi:WD40 repeat protein